MPPLRSLRESSGDTSVSVDPARGPRVGGANKSVTQKELARLVGVSQATVQRVLSGHPYIADDKRAKVLEAMERLNYRPNAAARAMRQGRHGVMGMMVVRDTRYFPGELLLAVAEVLAEADERIVILQMDDHRLADTAYIASMLRRTPVDGLLLHYPDRPVEPFTSVLARFSIPSVWLNRRRGQDDVYFDDAAAMREVVARLVAYGHRRIAYVEAALMESHRHESHYSRIDRPEAYAEAMRRAGLTPRVCTTSPPVDRPAYSPAMRDELTALLSEPDRPTALVCYGAPEAGGALSAALRLGLRVPEELSVAAYSRPGGVLADDGGLEMGLSLLHLDYAALGRQGARMLLRKVNGEADRSMTSRSVPVPLWERATTGPCARADESRLAQ